jgi:hypothetical protein
MLDSIQQSRDLLKGPMGDDAQFPDIDPRSGSPRLLYSVSATLRQCHRIATRGREQRELLHVTV